MNLIDKETTDSTTARGPRRSRASGEDLQIDSDDHLILRCRQGDVQAFGILVRRYQNVILRVAYRYLDNWSDAQDAAQETFLKAYSRLDTFDQARPFSSWLLRILINHCLDRQRWKRRRAELKLAEVADETSSAAERLGRSEAIQLVLRYLSPQQRRVLILRDLEGFSAAEVAEMLGCSAETVRVHHFHARTRFRQAWLRLFEEQKK